MRRKHMEGKLLYEDVTYKIRGACYDVWAQFGGAFKEKIVDRALTIALQKRGLVVVDQPRIEIYFEGQKIGIYQPDKIVNNLILVELKSKPFITQEDDRQFWRYLRGSQYKLGLLINFGTRNLEIKRRVYDEARSKIPQGSASSSA